MRSREKALHGCLILVGMAFVVLPAMIGQNTMGTDVPQRHLNPYTAEFRITVVQTLGNGTTITRKTKLVQARDSHGRTVTVTTNLAADDSQPGNSVTNVNDPADGSTTTWQSRSHQARIQKLPPPDQRHGCWIGDAGSPRAMFDPPVQPRVNQDPVRPVIEDLGTDTIDGIAVRGRRATTTIDAEKIGNNYPLVTTTEDWTAPSMNNLLLRSQRDDPQFGKTTRELVSLQLGEPDAAMFQPPADYQVTVDEMHQIPCDKLSPN
jgi:hypothetical protein